MKPARLFLTVCVLLLILIPSSVSAISIPDEKKLSKEFMEMIIEKKNILKDPAANHMIKTVGHHILSVLPTQPFEYSFYLLNDSTFNAFASPAANIFINRGLLTSLTSIDELAGIIGHEIAHAASRHVSESIDRSKLVSIGSMAGVLAGALIGSSGSGEAAQALTIGSLAAGQSAMLAFTRENETEADQKAILFLKQTCYSPQGLLSGLTIIRKSDYQGVEGIPDYFKTHPGTGKRIAHVASLLADEKPADKHKDCPRTYDFNMVKYRLIGLYEDPDKSLARVENLLKKDPDDPALNYCMGLLYARKHRRDKAVEYLRKTLSVKMFDPMVLLELGKVYVIDGQFNNARDLLKGIENDPVMGLWARYYLSIAQLESGSFAQAKENLDQVIEKEPKTFPRAYYHMAKIMSYDRKEALSHYFLGVYYSEIKDRKNAVRHLKKALESLEDPDLIADAKNRLKKKKI